MSDIVLLYNPETGSAKAFGTGAVPVSQGIMPSFFLGKDQGGRRVRLLSSTLDDGDQAYTVVCFDGWTVPVPFFTPRQTPPA